MSYENILANEATEVEAPKREKRVRAKSYAQYNEDGTRAIDPVSGAGIWAPTPCPNKPVKQPKAPKVPKEPEYKKDENGEFLLDEAGEYILVVKTRVPKLDADGNPIPRRANVYLDSQIITLTDKVPVYRAESKRGMMFASIKDGMTVGEFYEANGGKIVAHTFLVWYCNEAQVVEIT